jgi:hypothetical protein
VIRVAKTTTTTVQQDSNGYYSVRVPKALADAMNLAGAKVEWTIESSGRLSIEKVDD